MPLYKTINPNSQTCVKIWKIDETFNELLGPLELKPESELRVKGMKSEIHRCGFLSIRHLLREFGYTDQDLTYDAHGKPHLRDEKYISITHSFGFSSVIVSDQEVGIDIDKQRPIITNIASKFVDYEFEYLDNKTDDYIRKLTVIWCIKESLYKLFATPGLSFKQHVLVIPFTIEEASTISWIDYQTKKYRFNTHFLEFDGFTCAYALK